MLKVEAHAPHGKWWLVLGLEIVLGVIGCGSDGTSSSNSTSSSTGTGGSGATMNTGGAGGTDNTGGAGGTGNTGAGGAGGSGPPPGPCDNNPGGCGDGQGGCILCSYQGACANELAACDNSLDCIFFGACVDPCADHACIDNCIVLHPQGAQQFGALADCVKCDECYYDCANTNIEDPYPGCP